MIDFKTFVNTIFINKHEWKFISDDDKEKLFFIFNRFMSKAYPLQAQTLNTSGTDKVIAADIWFEFLRNTKGVPKWFWAGKRSSIKKDKSGYDERIMLENNLTKTEFEIIRKHHPDLLKEEIKELKEQDNAKEIKIKRHK